MTTLNTEDFAAAVAANARKMILEQREQRLGQLVRLIDELSGEMGSSDFRDAIRTKGYDIDACTMMLVARGVNVNN